MIDSHVLIKSLAVSVPGAVARAADRPANPTAGAPLESASDAVRRPRAAGASKSIAKCALMLIL